MVPAAPSATAVSIATASTAATTATTQPLRPRAQNRLLRDTAATGVGGDEHGEVMGNQVRVLPTLASAPRQRFHRPPDLTASTSNTRNSPRAAQHDAQGTPRVRALAHHGARRATPGSHSPRRGSRRPTSGGHSSFTDQQHAQSSPVASSALRSPSPIACKQSRDMKTPRAPGSSLLFGPRATMVLPLRPPRHHRHRIPPRRIISRRRRRCSHPHLSARAGDGDNALRERVQDSRRLARACPSPSPARSRYALPAELRSRHQFAPANTRTRDVSAGSTWEGNAVRRDAVRDATYTVRRGTSSHGENFEIAPCTAVLTDWSAQQQQQRAHATLT